MQHLIFKKTGVSSVFFIRTIQCEGWFSVTKMLAAEDGGISQQMRQWKIFDRSVKLLSQHHCPSCSGVSDAVLALTVVLVFINVVSVQFLTGNLTPRVILTHTIQCEMNQ